MELPQGLGARLQTKRKYLQEDYRRFPQDPQVTLALAECYLLSAVYRRQAAPVEADQLARAAQKLAGRFLPNGTLHLQAKSWSSLVWTEPNSDEMGGLRELPTGWGIGPQFFPAFSEGNDSRRIIEYYYSRTGRTAYLSDMVQGPTVRAKQRASTSNRNETHSATANSEGGLDHPRPKDIITETALEKPLKELQRQIGILTVLHRKQPKASQITNNLAHLLEINADIRTQLALEEGATGNVAASEPGYLQAVKLYEQIARGRSPRHVRGKALLSAASVCGRIGNRKQQLQFLRQASRVTPYEPTVWRQLSEVALSMEELVESRRASVEATRWRFPGLRMR